MHVHELHTVDEASVDPTEAAMLLAEEIYRQGNGTAYPSFGTPLKSAPWLPYSASTR